MHDDILLALECWNTLCNSSFFFSVWQYFTR